MVRREAGGLRRRDAAAAVDSSGSELEKLERELVEASHEIALQCAERINCSQQLEMIAHTSKVIAVRILRRINARAIMRRAVRDWSSEQSRAVSRGELGTRWRSHSLEGYIEANQALHSKWPVA